MPELTLKETQAVTELAKALYSFLPATAYPYSKPKVDFGTVARDVGIENLWPGGSKLPAIQTLLEGTLRTREALKYRNTKGNPITQEEMNRLNQLIVSVGFKIPELVDLNFISSLPKEKPKIMMEKMKPQERGYEFEKLLYDLFDIYGFNLRPSFRNTGEQPTSIIGFDGQDLYLIFET